MRQPKCIVRAVSASLIALSAGCAAPGGQVGSVQTQPGAKASASLSELQGVWRGTFDQIAFMGDSGRIHGDIVCQINGDGTYQTSWTTRMVAGSSRGGRLEMKGTVMLKGNRVTFVNSDGWHLTMKRDGDTMYAVAIDPAARRAHVALDVHKVREGQ